MIGCILFDGIWGSFVFIPFSLNTIFDRKDIMTWNGIIFFVSFLKQ